MKPMILISCTVFALACDKKKDAAPESTSSPAAAAEPAAKPVDDGLTAIPNISGLRAKVPAGAKPNAPGGAAGFHSADKTFSMVLREVSAGDANKTLTAAKKETEEFAFKGWIRADKTDDGWVMAWNGVSLDMDGNESPQVVFDVRRTLGGKTYTCSGTLATTKGLEESIAACQSIKGK